MMQNSKLFHTLDEAIEYSHKQNETGLKTYIGLVQMYKVSIDPDQNPTKTLK